MRSVIVGAGRVGLRTARVLEAEGNEVTLIDRDEHACRRADDEGLTAIEGDGATEAVLERAGIRDADAVAALTSDLNANFVVCMIGKHHGCRTVLRIDEDYRDEIYRRYATDVDEVIYPERLGAIGARNALLGGTVRAIADVATHLQILEVTVAASAPVGGYTISEVQLPGDATLLAFGKAGEDLRVPLPDETLEDGDRVVVLADFAALDDVRQLLVGEVPDGGGVN